MAGSAGRGAGGQCAEARGASLPLADLRVPGQALFLFFVFFLFEKKKKRKRKTQELNPDVDKNKRAGERGVKRVFVFQPVR